MKISKKFVLITILFGVPAFLLGRVIWVDPANAMTPTAGQLPLFMFLSVLEAVAFGFGIAFLILGWPFVKKLTSKSHGNAMGAFIAIAWTLVSWWPHDNMHRANGEDVAGLLRIEYLFHFTLIVSAFVIARFFWYLIQDSQNLR